LTRRGRLVAGLGLALALLSGGWAVAEAAAPGQGTHVRFVVVAPGDTLWSIASQHMDGDVRSAVVRLREFNGVSDYALEAGTRLILPR
jgi:predicted Zn-dependent protease